FPGHCPYLLRTREDIILLAHRLPRTSLHYSLDEARTWSANVLVDDCPGAYPSMVNLRDGSVLIIYYEEGPGSNIRGRRFQATAAGIEWLTFDRAGDTSSEKGRADTGAPRIRVCQEAGKWKIQGLERKVELDPATFKMSVGTGNRTWRIGPSFSGDLIVKKAGRTFSLKLAGAAERKLSPYETGFMTGLKIELSGYGETDAALDLAVQLKICLEGNEEDLVCEIIASDGESRVEECVWPAAFAAESFDATVVPFMQGMLLPKNWARKVWLYDTMSYGRGLYMPWWGHEQGDLAVLVVLETPDDAGCRFEHPAGGPTRVDPCWVHSLGRFGYPRRLRYCFIEKGNYVELAKRYRRLVVESEHFVSLKEKISRNPLVGELIGSPVIHTSILYHIQPASSYYHKDDPAKNHELVTFDERSRQLRQLSGRGINRAYVHLDGWGFRGYDNLHPDILPPCPEAGGWEGMRRLADACAELGYVLAVHDQYRDYYLDAESYDARHTILDRDGNRPTHATWYGGEQSFLCPSLAPGHVRKNFRALLERGIKIRGAYLDVFAVVPPDECYNSEHPVTRTECLRYRADCLEFVRAFGGVVSSEEPADWAIPYLDLVHHGPFALDPNPGGGEAMGIPVPLYSLVYHDALLIPWSLGKGAWGIPKSDLGFLHGLGNAGLPYLSIEPTEEELAMVRTMCVLHKRVGLTELVGHRLLDKSYRMQEFTYADGTRITIDLDSLTYKIAPEIELSTSIN
ncbi:MAG: DUF5696 domain-containing protein, partial [Acidobacteriota bacterium]